MIRIPLGTMLSPKFSHLEFCYIKVSNYLLIRNKNKHSIEYKAGLLPHTSTKHDG